MKPKISIIVPIYNTEKYLEKCLNSLVNQTMKDIEIICVDDSSPDNSFRIIEKFSKEDPRIKVIKHEKNLGLGGARNSGIRLAGADFIACIDSDDCISHEAFERLWEASNFGVYDIVCFGYIRVSPSGSEISRKVFKLRAVENTNNKINIFTAMNPSMCNKLWRKDLFVENDIYQPQELYYEDMATTPLLLAKAKKIKWIDDCLYYYLVREGSVTTTYSPKHIIDYFKVYEILYFSLIKFGLLERYSDDLFEYVNEGMRFHSNNVVNSGMRKPELNQYLRYLLMLKLSFLECYESLLQMEQDDIVDLLNNATTIEEVKKRISFINNENDSLRRKKSLNTLQVSGVNLFVILFKASLSPSQRKKLKNTPVLFFYDSQRVFTRLIGKLLKII